MTVAVVLVEHEWNPLPHVPPCPLAAIPTPRGPVSLWIARGCAYEVRMVTDEASARRRALQWGELFDCEMEVSS